MPKSRASGAIRPSGGHLRLVPDHERSVKQKFPSPRQKRCAGLNPAIYPAYLRDQVDYDYAGKLNDAERQWLAAFTEEWLKGWSLKAETQVLPPAAQREAWAAQRRLRRHRDPLAFAAERAELARALQAEGSGNVEDEVIRGIDQRRRR